MSKPKITETEEQLVSRAQQALSSCNWTIGECAALWTQKYAKGRTDAEFGLLIGLSGDQVYQRRRVWESFANVHEDYPNLKWSHFYVALNWEDATECLQWANELEATVAEMKAWRRSQHGDDLTEPAIEEPPFSIAPDYLTVGTGVVRDPDEFGIRKRGSGGLAVVSADNVERTQTANSAARDSSLPEYAPFGKGARGPAPTENSSSRPALSAEQIIAKAAATLERIVLALSPDVLDAFPELPIAVQQRFLGAVENFEARTAGLS